MKKKKILMSIAFLVTFSILFSPTFAKDDTFIKKARHTDAITIMGKIQPAKDEEVISWIAKDKMYVKEGDIITIIRFDLQKIYYINKKKMTYSEMDLPLDLEKALPAQFKQMMEMMEFSAKVTNTGETQKIKDWNCLKFLVEIDISMMGMNIPMKMEMWTTKDLGIDLDVYKKLYGEMLAIQPMMQGFAEEFEKIDGYPIMTMFSMQMMGTETKYQEEVLLVEKKDAPVGTYDLPEGLTKTAYDPFEQRGQ